MYKNFILFLFSILFFFNHSVANIDIKARTAILQDYLSGEILYEKEPDRSIYPASMTKIMTSIIAFDLIKSGDLSLDEKFLISEKAWRLSTAGYSSMFVMVGDQVSVENLLKGIIVASGNDSCIALAEGIAGTEEEFAILMTAKANELNMENTNFQKTRDNILKSRFFYNPFAQGSIFLILTYIYIFKCSRNPNFLKKQGKNIIISTHDINFAKSISEYIFMMKNGEIFDHGITSKVLIKNNIIECYDLNKFDNLDIIVS